MQQSISNFTRALTCLIVITFLSFPLLIGSVSSAIAGESIEAVINVDPSEFDLESNGRWATAYIEFPVDSATGVDQIDPGSVVLSVNGYVLPADPKPYEIGDYDLDGVPDLMVKFDRQILQSRMFAGFEELRVSGTADGTDFQGADTVSVVAEGMISTIIQTSDIHHHASGYGPFYDYTPLSTGDDGVTGGFARLATVIGGIKYQQAVAGVPTLLVDSGDYFMGTTYDLTAADPIALRFFTLMGYDAVTLGNHEFDWSPGGLYMLLNAGLANGFNVPVVASNAIPDGTVGTGDDGIEYLMAAGTIVNKKIIELDNGIRVGLLGLMGENADEDAPVAGPITFNHEYEFIQACVDDLKTNDGVDVVVALSHTGVNSAGNGEDAEIAEHVNGIDIIASGHSHTKTFEAFIKGDSGTLIFSPGEYGEWVSRLDFTYNKKLGRVVGFEFNLVPVNDSVPGDPGMQSLVSTYNESINDALAAGGLPLLKDTITTTDFDLLMGSYQLTGVTGLGSLCADSIRNVANALVPYGGVDGNPVHLGIVPTGVIRDEIFKGNTGRVTFSDVYNCLPLGISPDTSQPVPGYPMMHAYFTGQELYIIAEVALTASQSFGSSYYLNFSGAKIAYNPAYSPYFQGVRGISLYAPDDPLCLGDATFVYPTTDTNTLYHGVIDLYAFQLLYVVNDFLVANGLPTITPKDKDGNPIQNYMDFRIDRDPVTPGTQELKEWMALLNYLPKLGESIPSAIYGPGGAVESRVELVTY